MDLSEWQSEGFFYDYQSYQIFYRDNQMHDKPCVVCVHGFPTSSWDWREVWHALDKHYRVIALDMLGFGFSDKPVNHNYSISEQANIIQSLLSEKGIQNYHLVAHDFGTLVAQELLSSDYQTPHFPKLLSLLAMSGSIFPELSNPRLIQKLLISPVGPLITKLFNEKKFYRSLRRVFGPESVPDNDVLNAYWQLLKYRQGHKQLHSLNFFLKDRKFHGQRWAASWQKSEIPVRYIAGEADPMYGQGGIQKLRNISDKRDIHAIPGVGHFPHVESPGKVADLIAEFIR